MVTKLDLTELNKLFEKPSSARPSPKVQSVVDQAWLDQFFARIRLTEALSAEQQSPSELSPSNSDTTLVDEDYGLQHVFKASMLTEKHLFDPDVQMDIQMCSTINERSKHFVEEIHRRTEHRKALSMNTHIPQCRSTLSPSPEVSPNCFNPNAEEFVPSYTLPVRFTPSPSSSVSSTSINPNAAPFVPSHGPLIDSPPCSEIPDESWFPIFWEGVSTNDTDARQHHADTLIDNIEWESETLAVLSQHFCWKGAETTSDGLGGVVLFARVVHDTFRATYGDWYANCLTRHIRECVVGHFKACWKSVNPSVHITLHGRSHLSFVQDQPQSITYANPPSTSYLSSALSLTTFVGDLYAQGLLPRSAIHHCISVLVSELNAIEHIQAIHLLLLHANARLWRGKDANKAIRDFVVSFTQRASCMGDDASIMGNPFQKSEIRAWVKVSHGFKKYGSCCSFTPSILFRRSRT